MLNKIYCSDSDRSGRSWVFCQMCWAVMLRASLSRTFCGTVSLLATDLGCLVLLRDNCLLSLAIVRELNTKLLPLWTIASPKLHFLCTFFSLSTCCSS